MDERWHSERLARCRVSRRVLPQHLASLGVEGQQIAITCAADNLAILEDDPSLLRPVLLCLRLPVVPPMDAAGSRADREPVTAGASRGGLASA